MKSLVFLAIPLAIACNKTKDTASTDPATSKTENVAAVTESDSPWTQVVGRLEYKEKCPQRAEQSCLVITGGGDLNDTQIFEIPEGKTHFEKVADDETLKRFRIHLENQEAAEVNENQNVMLFAKVNQTPNGSQRIDEIKSISVMEK